MRTRLAVSSVAARLFFAVGLGVLMTPAALVAQATAPVLAMGSLAVGSPLTGTVTFTFSGSTTVASVSVVTQGATGLDFTAGTQTTGACAAGTYLKNATCTVVVKFTPLVAGFRVGAALLLDSSGNKLAVGQVNGTGNGGQLGFAPPSSPTQSYSNNGLSAVTIDAGGNRYNGYSNISKYNAAGTLLATYTVSQNINSYYAYGLAIDGAGYIYVAFLGLTSVYVIDPNTGISTVLAGGLSSPTALVLDSQGNAYLGSNSGGGGIYKVTPGGGVSQYVATSDPVFSLLLDGQGNLYYADRDYTHGGIYSFPVGASSPTLLASLPGADALARDPAGNMYAMTDGQVSGLGNLYELPAGSSTLTTYAVGISEVNPFLAIDSKALYIAGQSNNTSYVLDRSTMALSATGTTALNGTSSPQAVTVENDGNLSANFSSIGGTGVATASASTTCKTSTALLVAGTCTLGVEFAPVVHGSPQTNTLTLAGNFVSRTVAMTGYVTGDQSQLAFTTAPPASLQNGQNAGTVKVAIQDNGSGPTTSTSAVTLSVTGANTGYSMSYTVSAVSGMATYNLSGVALAIDYYTYTATGASVTSATTSETVYPYKLAFGTAPATPITAGGNAGTVTVAIQDNSGNATTQTNAVTLSVSGPGYSASYGPTTPVNGTATFNLSGVVLNTSGGYSYTATASGLTSSGANETVNPGAAVRLTAVAASTTSIVTIADTISVTALDAYGNIAAINDVVFLATGDTTATGTGGLTLANGVGSKAITFNTPGTYTVTATDVATPSVTTGTTASITVVPVPVYTVTVLTDPATGTAGNCTNQALSGATADASCSLRDAVAAVNALAITGSTGVQPVIHFATGINGQTIVVTAPLVLTANVNMAGPGPASVVTISGGGTTRILQQTTSSTATSISGLKLTKGFAATGAAFSSNVASAYTFTNDVFDSNGYTGTGGLLGGALYLLGGPTVVVAGCSFVNNTLTSTNSIAEGGAVFQTGGSLAIRNSPQSNTVFNGNLAQATQTAFGGALYTVNMLSGGLTISGATFIGNTAKSSATATYFTYGGAAYIQSQTTNSVVSITNSLFSGNTAAGQSTTYGGALYLLSGAVTTTGSTFTGNTVTFDTATTTSFRYGGAIYSTVATALYNDTITGNSALGTSGRYGGVDVAANSSAYNTVISGNTATLGYADGPNVSAGSNNYIDTSTTVTCTINCTPLLSALGNYGGPVQTMVPLPGSPLLAGGLATSVNSATTDGRGVGYPRTVSYNGAATHTDIGAVTANYSLSFVTQPANTAVNVALLPPPTVQVFESGIPFGGTGGTLKLAAAAGTPSFTSVATTASGLVSLAPVFTTPEAGDSLIVSVQSGAATLASGMSGTFNIGNTSAVSLAFMTAPTQVVTTGGNAGIVKVALTSAGGATNTAATAAVTLTVTGPSSYSQSYGPTAAVQGVVSFTLSGVALTMAGSYTYAASAAAYTTDTVVATETVGGDGVWVLDASGIMIKLSTAGALVSTVGAVGTATYYGGIAFNSVGDVWSVNAASSVLTYANASGGSTATYTGGGSSAPVAVAVDGAGFVWVANSGNSTVSEFTNARVAVSPAAGFGTSAGLSAPSGIALSATGGVWVTNKSGNSVTHVFGVATPVAAPLAVGVAAGTLGVRP